MSGQEITTAVAEKLPVIFAVLNDQALGMVKHGQRLGGAEPIGFELPPVDFAKMAEAMGANGLTLRSPEDFKKLDVDALINSDKPTLLDIYIDPEEIPPIGARVQTLSRGGPKE
jgi:acetolactate synthase-1/2/3 large subunit